jgi:two-component system, NarL family, nitrate/nitrite response regulator NarL
MFRDAVRAALAAAGGFAVVAVAGDGDEAVRCVLELRPHVLLIDLALPRARCLDALRRLNDANTGVLPVVLSDSVTSADVMTALALGARGLLTKDAPLPVLFDGLRAVARGGYWIDREPLRDIVDALRRARTQPPSTPAETLTPRETEIVAAVVDGATNQDVSASLGISVQTVKNHLSHVFDKLGVSGRVELALFETHRAAERERPLAGLRH